MTTTMQEAPAQQEDLLAYRSIPTTAILGAVFGLISASVLMVAASSFQATLMLVPIPVIGLLLSLFALKTVRSCPEAYTGAGIAWTGAVLSALFLFVGVGYSGYVYATEVPDGYQRISFLTLKPQQEDLEAQRSIRNDVTDMAGEQVFIKGYIRPDSTTVRTGMKRFLLVRDNQQCCFGDISKVQFYDQMQVELEGDLTADYSQRIFSVAGQLGIDPHNVNRGAEYPVFSLKADYVH
ncbi:hypothetical protein Pla175_45090 [Pirellulimonas nuda]|uniref:DUF4190 domain-containing protein n=1 Tax=Pirellulimonas nuda TaxID=2528009 RepID=A0A518DHY0_9BACT|nr:cytochrome d ubiquinol oxidase subunit II [Pirellulimonas nuda]QDU91091.1 hypothetical protein Pla175_45090 [Pirellulimonas nuda]